MTANQPTNLCPSARFVVERKPGKGYQVTSAEGSCADAWKGRGLALLDALGQPDPKGPAEDYYWLGPIAPSGEYVCVYMKRMPNGEAYYNQAWFRVPKGAPHPTRSIGLLIVVLLVVFAAGAFTGLSLFVPGAPTNSGPVAGNAESPGNGKFNPAKDSPPDVRMTKLKNQLTSSRDVRAKLKSYLSQEGFAADTSRPVVDEKRSVKLIADLDKTPPPQETIRLTNIEVAKVVNLLETLDEWTANPKAPPMSEGR